MMFHRVTFLFLLYVESKMMKNIFFFSPVAGGLNFLSEKFLVQNETIKGFMCEVCGKVFAVKYSVA